MATAGKTLIYTIDKNRLKRGITFVDNERIIVYNDENGRLTATRNVCKHEGGQFPNTDGCVLTCPGHGWKLDASTMTYVVPIGGLKQHQLLVEDTLDGYVEFYQLLSSPWEWDSTDTKPLSRDEFTIRFYAHACVEIKCGSKILFTDPWLVGPAFVRGWWLIHKPPADWLDRLASADAIYISHNHSDHLNPHTLKQLAGRNPQVPIFVPAFEDNYCVPLLNATGLFNIHVTEFDQWMLLGENAQFMILRDGTGRNDSGILIDYKGHRILNTVDCHNLHEGNLPNVDVLLTSFAGGASGYPLCWDLYSEHRRIEMVNRKRRSVRANVLATVMKIKPKIYIPFAGYFTEAHPADRVIQTLNVKNRPDEVCEAIRTHCPETATWIPQPGGVLDISTEKPSPAPVAEDLRYESTYEFDRYVSEIRESEKFPPLQTKDGLHAYFAWAGFRGNVVLHVIETDEDFQRTLREFYVDFDDLSFPATRPLRPHQYIRMRCRADVFRHVLRYCLPWEEITIGFQARLFRDPDVYEFPFWDHFQNKLPHTPPVWCSSEIADVAE